MKKFFPFLLLFVYLISATELHQLFKIPLLVGHYITHKSQNSKITISDFLEMHYLLTDDGDNDQQEDMKLPFKSHDGCTNLGNSASLPLATFSLVLKDPTAEVKLYKQQPVVPLCQLCAGSIWQPPKNC